MYKKLLKQNYVKFGLYMSLVVVVCLLIMHWTGEYTSFDQGGTLDLVFLLSPFVLWLLGLLSYKKKLHNQMSFKQGLAEGVRISLVFGILSPFIFMGYYLLLNPAILDYVSRSYGMTDSSITSVILVDMTVQFVGVMVLGTVYTSVLSFFLKSRK